MKLFNMSAISKVCFKCSCDRPCRIGTSKCWKSLIIEHINWRTHGQNRMKLVHFRLVNFNLKFNWTDVCSSLDAKEICDRFLLAWFPNVKTMNFPYFSRWNPQWTQLVNIFTRLHFRKLRNSDKQIKHDRFIPFYLHILKRSWFDWRPAMCFRPCERENMN